MQCERCDESAVTRRDDVYLCGRCALKLDWVAIARTAQGAAVRQAVSAAAPQAAPAPPADSPPADPFAG